MSERPRATDEQHGNKKQELGQLLIGLVSPVIVVKDKGRLSIKIARDADAENILQPFLT